MNSEPQVIGAVKLLTVASYTVNVHMQNAPDEEPLEPYRVVQHVRIGSLSHHLSHGFESELIRRRFFENYGPRQAENLVNLALLLKIAGL